MDKKIKVAAVQFARAGVFKKNMERVHAILEAEQVKEGSLDFLLLGGEFSLNESKNTDPYPLIQGLAREYKCNIVAPINANFHRYPKLRDRGFSSTHVFQRDGEVAGIQDKLHFYWKERPWFRPGNNVQTIEIEGIRIGCVRGLDIVYQDYCNHLRDADITFFSTMAEDNLMLDFAKVRAIENESYFVMTSYLGPYAGLEFSGNAVVIAPTIAVEKKMKFLREARLLCQTEMEGFIIAELDLNYLQKARADYPLCAN